MERSETPPVHVPLDARQARAGLLALTVLLLLALSPRAAQGNGATPPAPAADDAAVEAIADEDAALRARLRSVLGAVDAFAGMEVDVRAGVVVLSGSAPSREVAAQAVALAKELPGVLFVVDDVAVERGLSTRFEHTLDAAGTRLREAVAALPLLGVALLIVGAAWLLARVLRDATALYRFASERALLQNLLRQTVFAAVIAGGVVAALRFLDAGAVIGTILGAAGVVGLALGFAFRNIVENYLAGILLALRQPFNARDVVSVDGVTGTVLRMTTSETTLLDADGNHVRLPNAMVFNGKVLNYTRNPLRRFTVKVGVGTDVDLDRAQELGVATLQRMNGVVDDPTPSARIAVLGESSVGLELYGWVHQERAGYFKVASEAHRLVKACFDEHGIAMPAPALDVRLDAPPPVPVAAPAPPPTLPASGPPPERIDVAPGDDVTGQVERELARTDEESLLEEDDGRAPS